MAARRPAGQDGDLFSAQEREAVERGAPLAARMRPRSLDEFLGQEHIVLCYGRRMVDYRTRYT